MEEIRNALAATGHEVIVTDLDAWSGDDLRPRIVLASLEQPTIVANMRQQGASPSADLRPEGFSLRQTTSSNQVTHWIIGADYAGVMYGGMEVAEVIRVGGLKAVKELDQNPYLAKRGTKFNIPLDARTPSYSDVSDAAQNNIAEMWSFDFWKEYIDTLARYRYNFVSCWNLHPFPSLIRVPEYPDVALADVHRSKAQWQEHYDLEGTGFDAPEILNNVEVLKKMTIEEKIAFWRKVMAYGKSRNISFYFVTWNVFVNGIDGKYGITDEVKNPVTRDYFRKSVKQLFITYPDLMGIGLTTGENMYGSSFQEKEDWAFDTYAQGVLDVTQEQPNRKMTLIHRQHMAAGRDIAEKFKPIIAHPNIEFVFSFKYAQAHVYSSTTQTFHTTFVNDIQSQKNLKTLWTLRNDDIFYFRWGAPDFVREFFKNIPYDVSRGYYYGSDQYIWGREFLMREPESPRQIEIVKHWYQWMLWGRLGYDPNVSNERFTQIIQARYPRVDAGKLFAAWQEASMIYPTTTGFHWGALDFQWYIEGSQSRPGPTRTPFGFHDVNRFITLPTHGGTDNISIPNFVRMTVDNLTRSGTTPLQVADKLHKHSDKALGLLEDLDHYGDKELRLTLDDIRTIAWLGKYYAHKIQAATALAFFRETLKLEYREEAVKHLQVCAFYWRAYASLALGNHRNPLWTNRVGHVDWRKTFSCVIHDIRTIGGTVDVASLPPTSGGTILEAEDVAHQPLEAGNSIDGFTGTGYVAIDRDKGKHPITWTWRSKQAGPAVLEFRYINSWNRETPLSVTINGKDAGSVWLWDTGTPKTWAWDRLTVELAEGENQIRIQAPGRILVDHVNILHVARN